MPRADVLEFPAPARLIPPPEFHREGAWLRPYRPLFPQGDVQTVAAHYWPRSLDEHRFPTRSRFFQTEADTQVLARLNQQPGSRRETDRPTVLAIHGLTACDRAPYMISAAGAALAAGFDAVRLNVRNCGGTEHLCRTLYHSGLTTDLARVVEELAPRPLLVLGFSMGGNMALKLAGEWGASPPAHVRAVCAVSPPVRLDLCSRNIGRPRNIVYEQRFLFQLRAAMRRKHQALPRAFPLPALGQLRSIWQFDEIVTAPAFGFRDAMDYYRRCSAAAFLDAVRLPTLVIQARDDPFVPFEAFDSDAFRTNPWLRLVAPPRGGHVAFLAQGKPRFWAQAQALAYFTAALE